jgi:hypothetical protein
VLAVSAVCAQVAGREKSAVRAFTDADWPRYAGDYAGTKYSTLTGAVTGRAQTCTGIRWWPST